MMKRQTVVVTRHAGLVEYLREQGLVDQSTPVIQHATEQDVSGKHVIGILPLHLAALCWRVTEIPLTLTQADREHGDLPVTRVREIAAQPRTYRVTSIPTTEQRTADRLAIEEAMGSCGTGSA